jgi:hypothetical protein
MPDLLDIPALLEDRAMKLEELLGKFRGREDAVHRVGAELGFYAAPPAPRAGN